MSKTESKTRSLTAVQLRVLGNMVASTLGPLLQAYTSAAEVANNKAHHEYDLANQEWEKNTKDARLAEARRRPSTYIIQHETHGVTLDLVALNKAMEKKYPKPVKPALFNRHSGREDVLFASLEQCGGYSVHFSVPKEIAPIIRGLAHKIDCAVLTGVGEGLAEAIASTAEAVKALCVSE